jgi:hypothetical protein
MAHSAPAQAPGDQQRITQPGHRLTRITDVQLVWLTAFVLSLVVMAILGLPPLFSVLDYVGPDNDDAMRLVQVRDFLNGQGWFDMMQYRLGFEPGTLMHWSRLIDLPIAALIRFFEMFFPTETAEKIGLYIWPLSLVFPLISGMALAGLRFGGRSAIVFSAGLAAIFAVSVHRYHPGSIDHHNVQMVLVAWIAAMVLDPQRKATSGALAGFFCASALAVGVETTPLMVVVAGLVGCNWIWNGRGDAQFASAFGLSLAAFVALAFFSTVPVARYTAVTCDNLSISYAALSVAGGVLLAIAAIALSQRQMMIRFAGVAVCGLLLVALILQVAPQCLHNPLDDLDPLLISLWLNHVSEAQSIVGQFHHEPGSLGTYYAVAFLGVIVCLWRIFQRDRVHQHLIILILVSAALLITLLQIRAYIFSTLLASIPLSYAIARAQFTSNANPKSVKAGLAYIGLVLGSVSAVWSITGILITEGPGGIFNTSTADATPDCRTKDALSVLAGLPAGLVYGPSNLGAPILRFTQHRVLAAPYHRNPKGLLAGLQIGMATPQNAGQMLHDAGVTYIAFCKNDVEVEIQEENAKDGLNANLMKGVVPAWLQAVDARDKAPVIIYRVLEPTAAASPAP